jgi:hypothetical protein
LNAAGDEVAPAAAFSMPEMATFLNRRFYGIFTPPLTRPDSCVASFFKMLTYSRVCCAFSSVCALLSNLIRGFEMASDCSPTVLLDDSGSMQTIIIGL